MNRYLWKICLVATAISAYTAQYLGSHGYRWMAVLNACLTAANATLAALIFKQTRETA
jgi:hypothetical protein